MSGNIYITKGKGPFVQVIKRSTKQASEDWAYLYKIGKKYPPVSEEMERHMLSVIHGVPTISPLDTMIGVKKKRKPSAKTREEFRKRFMLHNLRLAMSIVKRGRSRTDPLTMPLVSAGIAGILIAIDKFNVSLGKRFSTYATRWIEALIVKELRFYLKEIHPDKTLIGKEYAAMYRSLKKQLDNLPSQEEIFEALGWTHRQITDYLSGKDVINKVPLDLITKYDTDGEHSSLVVTENDPKDIYLDTEISGLLKEGMKGLTSLEYAVICRTKGLFGQREQKYRQASESLGVSIATVKNMETSGLRKMHRNLRSVRKDFIPDTLSDDY